MKWLLLVVLHILSPENLKDQTRPTRTQLQRNRSIALLIRIRRNVCCLQNPNTLLSLTSTGLKEQTMVQLSSSGLASLRQLSRPSFKLRRRRRHSRRCGEIISRFPGWAQIRLLWIGSRNTVSTRRDCWECQKGIGTSTKPWTKCWLISNRWTTDE